MNLDPLDIGGSVLGRVVRGLFVFLLSGCSGVMIGSVCSNYRSFEDFIQPENAMPDFGDFFAILFIWPIFVLFKSGIGLLILFPLLCYSFIRSLFSELVPQFALLSVSLSCAIVVVFDDGNWLSWIVFAAISIGYGYLGWIVVSRDHNEKIDWLIQFLNRDDAVPTAEIRGKKVGLKAWGEKVELNDDEWKNK